VEELLNSFTVFQVRRVVLRHVLDVHRAGDEVLRDLFSDKMVRALTTPPRWRYIAAGNGLRTGPSTTIKYVRRTV
jgi:hypothetical protein